MDSDLVSKFKLKYESLAGIVHIVENEAAVAGVVLDILKEVQGRRVALGDLPEPLLKPIETACADAENSHEFFELVGALENEVQAGEQTLLKGRTYGFHIACHQRSLGAGSHAIDFLKRRGAEIEVVERFGDLVRIVEKIADENHQSAMFDPVRALLAQGRSDCRSGRTKPHRPLIP